MTDLPDRPVRGRPARQSDVARLAGVSQSAVSRVISGDASAAAQRTLQSEQGGQAVSGAMAPPVVRPVGAPSMPSSSGVASQVRITYVDGTVKGLLDAAAARFGVSWRYADSGVQFYFTDTRSFQIRAIPGDASLNANVGNNSSSESGGGETPEANSSSSTLPAPGAVSSGKPTRRRNVGAMSASRRCVGATT